MKDLNFEWIYSFLISKQRRYRASGYLLIALVTAVVVSTISLSVAKINHSIFSGTQSYKVAIQAQEYALAKVDFLRTIKYSEVAAQSKKAINNTENYYDEIIVGTESTYPGNTSVKQKVCTVNVYKGEELLPRYSMQLIKLSKSEDSSLPSGSIIAWYGQIADIPSGFALCNGSNGTPDLRDRFLVGAGSTYILGATGGSDTVKLTGTQIGNHYHFTGWHNNNNTGRFPTTAGTLHNPSFPSGYSIAKWNGSGGGGYSGYDCSGWNMITSLAVSSAAQESHENRPPYFALYFIMKL